MNETLLSVVSTLNHLLLKILIKLIELKIKFNDNYYQYM